MAQTQVHANTWAAGCCTSTSSGAKEIACELTVYVPNGSESPQGRWARTRTPGTIQLVLLFPGADRGSSDEAQLCEKCRAACQLETPIILVNCTLHQSLYLECFWWTVISCKQKGISMLNQPWLYNWRFKKKYFYWIILNWSARGSPLTYAAFRRGDPWLYTAYI